MTGLKQKAYGVESDCSAIWANTTANNSTILQQ